MKILGFATLLLALIATGAQTQQRDPCKGETTYEMKMCAAKRYKQADDELNKVYRELMSKLEDEGHKATLKTAQQAWLKYRDGECDFVSYLNRGGTIYSVVQTECMTSLTNSRIKELKEDIKDLEP
jgi:uncharacterized protein YecT (DUF1311 family)